MNKCTRCGEVNPAEIHTCTPQTKAQRLAYELDSFMENKSLYGASAIDKAAAELRRLDALNAELVEALLDVTVSLVAAHNLLQNGGKKAAASDKMFSLMLNDYEKSFELGRAVLAKAKEQT